MSDSAKPVIPAHHGNSGRSEESAFSFDFRVCIRLSTAGGEPIS